MENNITCTLAAWKYIMKKRMANASWRLSSETVLSLFGSVPVKSIVYFLLKSYKITAALQEFKMFFLRRVIFGISCLSIYIFYYIIKRFFSWFLFIWLKRIKERNERGREGGKEWIRGGNRDWGLIRNFLFYILNVKKTSITLKFSNFMNEIIPNKKKYIMGMIMLQWEPWSLCIPLRISISLL